MPIPTVSMLLGVGTGWIPGPYPINITAPDLTERTFTNVSGNTTFAATPYSLSSNGRIGDFHWTTELAGIGRFYEVKGNRTSFITSGLGSNTTADATESFDWVSLDSNKLIRVTLSRISGQSGAITGHVEATWTYEIRDKARTMIATRTITNKLTAMA